MRKILFLTVAFALVGTSAASAQVLDQVYDKAWGVKVGVSVADLDVDDPTDALDTSNQTGFAAGAFIHKYWGILGGQLELNYIEKGAKFSFDDGVVTDEFTTDIKYIEPAALLKAALPLGIVRLGVFGGVGFDIKLSCDTSDPDVDCDDLASTDWTGILGLDTGFYLGPVSLWIDGRYNVGLSDLSDAEDTSEELFGDVKNRAWTVQAGLGFEI